MQAYLVYSILMRCEIFGGREQQWVAPKTLSVHSKLMGLLTERQNHASTIQYKNKHDKTSQVL